MKNRQPRSKMNGSEVKGGHGECTAKSVSSPSRDQGKSSWNPLEKVHKQLIRTCKIKVSKEADKNFVPQLNWPNNVANVVRDKNYDK